MPGKREPYPGCTQWCCTTELGQIPPKPDDIAWVDYAPHLNGHQITHLAKKWRNQSRNTGKTGAPVSQGATVGAGQL